MATKHINKVVRFGASPTCTNSRGHANNASVTHGSRWGEVRKGIEGAGTFGRKINRYTISGAQIHTFRWCNVFAVLQKILFSYVTKKRVVCADCRIMWRLWWWEIGNIVVVSYTSKRFIGDGLQQRFSHNIYLIYRV